MNDTKKPVGYGHDNTGASGGGNVGGGKPGVAHTVAADKSAGEGKAPTPNSFFIDDREIDIREDETIFRAARRLDIKLPHLCYSPRRVIGRTATAGSAWSRSRASACSPQAASARRRPA